MSYNITNFRNDGDMRRKEDDLMRSIRTQAKLNADYDQAMTDYAANRTLNITPVATRKRTVEEERRDVVGQKSTLFNNLKTVMDGDQAQRVINDIPDTMTYIINNNWSEITTLLKGRKNLTADFFRRFAERFIEKQATTEDTGIVIPLQPTDMENLRDELRGINDANRDQVLLAINNMNPQLQATVQEAVENAVEANIPDYGVQLQQIIDTLGNQDNRLQQFLATVNDNRALLLAMANQQAQLTQYLQAMEDASDGRFEQMMDEIGRLPQTLNIPEMRQRLDEIFLNQDMRYAEVRQQLEQILAQLQQAQPQEAEVFLDAVEQLAEEASLESLQVQVNQLQEQTDLSSREVQQRLVAIVREALQREANEVGEAMAFLESMQPAPAVPTPAVPTPADIPADDVLGSMSKNDLKRLLKNYLKDTNPAVYGGINPDTGAGDALIARNYPLFTNSTLPKPEIITLLGQLRDGTAVPTPAPLGGAYVPPPPPPAPAQEEEEAPADPRAALMAMIAARGRRGSGVRSRRIVRGRGISKDTSELYTEFGKYLIHRPSLRKRTMNLKFPSGSSIPRLPPFLMSKELTMFIEQILATGEMDFPAFHKLPDKDKKVFEKICHECQITKKMGLGVYDDGGEKDKDLERFELVRGQVMAGNNNKDLLQELRYYVLKFIRNGQMNKQTGHDILFEIASLA